MNLKKLSVNSQTTSNNRHLSVEDMDHLLMERDQSLTVKKARRRGSKTKNPARKLKSSEKKLGRLDPMQAFNPLPGLRVLASRLSGNKQCLYAKDLYQLQEILTNVKNPFVDPQEELDTHLAAKQYWAHHLLKKAESHSVSEQACLSAITKYFAGERVCRTYNVLLSSARFRREHADLIWRIQCRIGSWIGAKPKFLHTSNSSGATVQYTRSQINGNIFLKEKGAQSIHSRLAVWFSKRLLEQRWGRLEIDDSLPESVITVIPKDVSAGRVISKSTNIDQALQLMLGRQLRDALCNKARNDINTQIPNQVLAHRGSIDGSYATIDLENASNTISREVVRLLFPPLWYTAFDACRAHTGVFNLNFTTATGKQGRFKWLKPYKFQMFSAMGNGYTFELETMLFLAICQCVATRPQDVRVYGDDIICHTSDALAVTEALQLFGFSVNKEKSFTDPNFLFRESCGKHYLKGVDITPIKWRHLENNTLFNRNVFVNGILRSNSCYLEDNEADLFYSKDDLWGPPSEINTYLHTYDIDKWNLKYKFNSYFQTLVHKVPIEKTSVIPIAKYRKIWRWREHDTQRAVLNQAILQAGTGQDTELTYKKGCTTWQFAWVQLTAI